MLSATRQSKELWRIARCATPRRLSVAAAPVRDDGVETATAAPPRPCSADGRTNVLGMTFERVRETMEVFGERPYRAEQLYGAVFRHGARSLNAVKAIPKGLRERLRGAYAIDMPTLTSSALSPSDGTAKFVLAMPGGGRVETVFIPERPSPSAGAGEPVRGTVCVSSQVGCSLSCAFCHTGTMDKRALRNLAAGEIVGQVLAVGDHYPALAGGTPALPTNVVFMGMGEPLYNWRAVSAAVHVLADPRGIGMGRRRITVSTSGIVPLIERVGRDLDVRLAVSLHAARDELRDRLVPINRTYPLEALIDACHAYVAHAPLRKITFEYVLLSGVNDSAKDAEDLGNLLRGMPCLLNLIPFNPWEGSGFQTPSRNAITAFAKSMEAYRNIECTVRWPRGRDIMAACGQLKTSSTNGSA